MKKNIYQTTVTQRGQVTIPSVVRDMLNVGPYDKVTFEINEGEVLLKKRSYSLEDVYGSVQRIKSSGSIDNDIRVAKEERAQKLYNTLKRT